MTDDDPTGNLFQICRNVFTEEGNVDQAVQEITKLFNDDPSIPSLLIDVLVAIEAELQIDKNKDHIAKFQDFCNHLSGKVIPQDILVSEIECMDPNLAANKQQLVRIKTKLYFKQSKFNLLREESEGYAKLITELLEIGNVSVKAVLTRLYCLIGQFNLDPNRVTDIVMECFEHIPNQKQMFIALLKEMNVNRDYLCTLLGFKFTFYQSAGRLTPYSLYVVTAALIQGELIDLMKITSFMKPNADGIKETHKARTKNAITRAEKAETILTSQVSTETSKYASSDPHSESTAAIGFAVVLAAQETVDLSLVGQFSEEMVLGTNQKLGLVCALMELGDWPQAKHLIDRLPEFYAVQSSKKISKALAKMIDYVIDDFYLSKCPQQLEGISSEKREWNVVGIDKVTSYEGLTELSNIFWYLGPRLAYLPKVMVKVIRLFVHYFNNQQQEDPEGKCSSVFMSMIDEILLPGLSLLPSSPNAALSEEMWNLLQIFPYHRRYWLYGRWKTLHTSRHPELTISRGKIHGRTKYVLKRLSKETVKVIGRQLGKLCHVQPLTVFDYLLSQIQTFDNLIQPVVESFKFLTNLEFDVLAYCIIEQLANPDKQQLKASDGTLSPWLQALATMVGAIYKKYTVDLSGILNYVANQLKNEKSFDLILLREIIQNMSSVESFIGATADQLEALQGGKLLKNEAGGFSTARNNRACSRLRDALMEGDLSTGLCILIAQQRECVIHNDSAVLPLKLVGEVVDQCRDTFMQFGTFLQNNIKMDEYIKRIPSMGSLLMDYHINMDAAAFLSRSSSMHRICTSYDESKKARKLLEGDGKQRLDNTQKFLFFKEAIDQEMDQLVQQLTPAVSPYRCNDVPLRSIIIFWLLSLYDIEVPHKSYDKAMENIRKQIDEVVENNAFSKSKRQKEEERLRNTEKSLKEEQRKQTEHVERVRMWLAQERQELFNQNGQQTVGFLQQCIIPRAIYSELDGIFCAKLVLLLHKQATTFFQTLVFVDKTFIDLLPLMCGLSENEAASLGGFLEIILAKTLYWHSDKAIFDKECENFPGFITKISSTSLQKPNMDYDCFRKLCFKWQSRMYNVFSSILTKENNEYVLLRNTLVIMSKLVSGFPVLKDHHHKMEAAVLQVRDWEKGRRDDLSLKAASYAAKLKMCATKLLDKEHFAPPDALKSKPKSAQNGETSARKRLMAVSGTPEVRRKSAKIEPKEAEVPKKNGVEVKTEVKVEKETEEGEVAPSPPAKKARSSLVSSASNGTPKDSSKKVKEEREPDENREKEEHKQEESTTTTTRERPEKSTRDRDHERKEKEREKDRDSKERTREHKERDREQRSKERESHKEPKRDTKQSSSSVKREEKKESSTTTTRKSTTTEDNTRKERQLREVQQEKDKKKVDVEREKLKRRRDRLEEKEESQVAGPAPPPKTSSVRKRITMDEPKEEPEERSRDSRGRGSKRAVKDDESHPATKHQREHETDDRQARMVKIRSSSPSREDRKRREVVRESRKSNRR